MALKNESIEVIRSFAPDAYLGPEIEKTKKGTVAHLRPAADALRRSAETAPVKWIVFPRWRPGVPSRLSELPKAEAFMFLATNAFNYELIGEPAFHTVADLVDNARCFRFEYSDLANAVAALTDFVRRNDV
jgi:HprK-related kinase A